MKNIPLNSVLENPGKGVIFDNLSSFAVDKRYRYVFYSARHLIPLFKSLP